jgi:hypothetical protein
MTRPHPKTRTLAVVAAVAALAASAGAALGFNSLPTAAGPGLERASDASGQSLPARPATVGAPTLPDQAAGNGADEDAQTEDAAPAEPGAPTEAGAPTDTHGAAVSAVATGDDPTPDTNRGADVSAVAKDNAGQVAAAEHRPPDAGKPADAGKPDGVAKPADPGKPDNPGRP